MITLSALNSRLQLSIEQIDKYGLFSFLESIPELFADLCISPVATILILDIWLLSYFIDILMERLEQYT